jgi:hypothetical protein
MKIIECDNFSNIRLEGRYFIDFDGHAGQCMGGRVLKLINHFDLKGTGLYST